MELLRDMALFVEVVNTKSFTVAAENLGVAASTLSRRIAALEAKIGLRLLNRTTRRVEVSEAGAAYYARCSHLVAEARIAHEELAHMSSTASGTLRLSATPDFAVLHLPALLTEFTKLHPAVNVEMHLSYLPADLFTEGLDAALRLGALPDSSLVSRHIADLGLGLYASPAYIKAAPPLREPADLRHHVCLRMHSGEFGSNWTLYPVGSRKDSQNVEVSGRFVASSVSFIRQLALLGAGIGIMDSPSANVEVAKGRLVHVLPGWRLPPKELHLLTPSRLSPARVRAFGDFLVQTFAEEPSAQAATLLDGH
jgi:DNA-binding transcriptional LysR family regulator